MTKLLHRPLKIFAIYALIILVGSIPVYYSVVDYIWLGELDEQNLLVKARITAYFETHPVDDESLQVLLDQWSIILPGTKLEQADTISTQDEFYEVTKQNHFQTHYEMDRFRGYSSHILINDVPYWLTIETNVEEADETMLAIAAVTILFFVLLVVGFMFLNKYIAKQSWASFYDTLKRLAVFDLNRDKTIDFVPSEIEEFETLNTTLTQLIDRNVTIYEQQKSFIENASHELQTPIAVLKSKVDLLLQHPDTTHAQSDIVNAIYLPLSRMSRINKNLLLLAKIENSQYLDHEAVVFSDIVEHSLMLLEDYISGKGIEMSIAREENLKVDCSRFLAETLVNNLVSNAIRHGSSHSTVTVKMDHKMLSVENAGLVPLDQENLFKRFSGASAQSANAGLGLSIIKEICARYGWTVGYQFQNNTHVFFIRF